MYRKQVRRWSLQRAHQVGNIDRDRLWQRLTWDHLREQVVFVRREKDLGLVIETALSQTSCLEVLGEVVVWCHLELLDLLRFEKKVMTREVRDEVLVGGRVGFEARIGKLLRKPNAELLAFEHHRGCIAD